ncbi:MAG: hypothetical protein WA130_20015 [Candidatus Methanoperedens sp.]
MKPDITLAISNPTIGPEFSSMLCWRRDLNIISSQRPDKKIIIIVSINKLGKSGFGIRGSGTRILYSNKASPIPRRMETGNR